MSDNKAEQKSKMDNGDIKIGKFIVSLRICGDPVSGFIDELPVTGIPDKDRIYTVASYKVPQLNGEKTLHFTFCHIPFMDNIMYLVFRQGRAHQGNILGGSVKTGKCLVF